MDNRWAETIDWLLESADPGVRYLALRDLRGTEAAVGDLAEAKHLAHSDGPIGRILAKMQPEGYWVKPGPGYSGKYKSTVWSVISLAQLGADPMEDERINSAIAYVLTHTLQAGGLFSCNGTPDGTFDCLQGNMCYALYTLGCRDDRLMEAFDWLARSQTGEGVAKAQSKETPRGYAVYKTGPDFCCGVNAKKPCAWGAVKVLNALACLPERERSDVQREAVKRGVDLLFSVDLMTAAWPTRGLVSKKWWKLSFPLFYTADLLQAAEVLTRLGHGHDERAAGLMDWVVSKADGQGRWAMDESYRSVTWGQFGTPGKPNKWVTLRALRVIKALEGEVQSSG